ncbi:MAG: pectinesterase family protein, partial [SAR202 cluster bacterium]|nr:pectinesterase family protein [SAR202 cluster bacterium]
MMDSQWRKSVTSASAVRIFAVALLALLFVVSYESSPSVVSAASWTDCSQALYVAMEGNGGGGTDVYRYDCNGNEIDRYASGFTGTSGLTIDSMGNMYISDDSPGIWKVTPSGAVTSIASNVTFQNPNGLYLDSSGRLLVADSGNSVLRLTLDPATGDSTLTELLAQGFNNPQGVIEGATGTVLFTDTTGYIWQVTPTSTVPLVAPASGDRFHSSSIAMANQGHLAKDQSGNIYISDFGDRIVRLSPDGATAVDVVNIDPTTTCPPGQSGGDSPGFRGFAFTPDYSGLVATGYCLDNIYVFPKVDLDAVTSSSAAISSLPTPLTENPSAALDGNINGPFGVAFFATNASKPHIRTCVLPSKAPTLWVDKTFTGATSTGSSSQPFKTINAAVSAVATGTESVIQVRPGVYAEIVDILKPMVHIRGEGPGATIIDAGPGKLNGFRYGADGITIGNFRFINAEGAGFVSGVAVKDITTPRDVVICNNVFVDNEVGVGVGNSSPLIVNNTFFNNVWGVELGAGSTSTIIRNNIFQGEATTTNTFGVFANGSATSTIDHNLFYNLNNNLFGGSSLSCTSGCILGQDPQLVDPMGGDFHLGPTSTAIDAGTSIGAPLNDFETDSRPIDGDGDGSLLHDMGADETKSGKGTIEGNKFNDRNSNSANDSEPGLSGWTIYLDNNNNGMLDSGEATTTTDSLGNYRFSGVVPGTTTVRELAQAGWTQTYPTNYRAMLSGGSEVPPVDTNANGGANLEYNASTSKLMFNVWWNNLEGGTTTNLHIHEGAPGAEGGVVYDLLTLAGASSTNFASPVKGTVTLDATSTANLLGGNLYVNLHTSDHSGGELRG